MQLFDHFFLPADAVEKGRAFYQEVLGLQMKFALSAQGMLAFTVGKAELALFLGKAWNKPAMLKVNYPGILLRIRTTDPFPHECYQIT